MVTLRIVGIICNVVAVVALVVAIIGVSEQSSERRAAAYDTCYLVRGLVFSATTSAPTQRAAAQAFINRTPLRSCDIYSYRIGIGK